MSAESVAARVGALVGEITARDVNVEVDGSRTLRDLGVSSLRMIELIGSLESTFGFRVGDDDIDEDNFGTLSGLALYVEGRVRS